uniref:Uncharacterized protein n=1 Tax=Aegilops tauschii subsp. strangulata TaxID=200361 RepID=A0A453QVF9_AEGTS
GRCYRPAASSGISFDNFPHHKIGLKLGVPGMLLRKIKPTTVWVTQLNSLATRKPGWTRCWKGDHYRFKYGQRVCIPWIVVSSPGCKWPFTLLHRRTTFNKRYPTQVGDKEYSVQSDRRILVATGEFPCRVEGTAIPQLYFFLSCDSLTFIHDAGPFTSLHHSRVQELSDCQNGDFSCNRFGQRGVLGLGTARL